MGNLVKFGAGLKFKTARDICFTCLNELINVCTNNYNNSACTDLTN